MENILLLTPDNETSYASMWRNALVEQSDCFRIALEDNPAQDIPTKFHNESFTMGIFDGGKLMGSVSLERDTRVKFRHKALLFKMFIHNALAGKGNGRKLIMQTIHAAQKMGDLRQIYLTVLASNHRAIHLYTSLGFVAFANEPAAVRINETFVDEIQMVYLLNETRPADRITDALHTF